MSKYIGVKPLIEEHYHINDLIEKQERRSEDRQMHKDRIAQLEEREKLIADAKPRAHTDFYCSRCAMDFSGNAILQIEVDWTNENQRLAFYKLKHRNCGNWCIRLVTDKHRDPFWFRSRRVARERQQYFKDTVQPHEDGFNLLYGKGKLK